MKRNNLQGQVVRLETEKLHLENEIERLNKRIEDLNIINEEHQILNGMIRKELQQKENILKEVREYIKDKYAFLLSDIYFLEPDEEINKKRILHILELLDKEVN